MKERTKLTKFYYKNGQRKEDQQKLMSNVVYCTEQVLKAKNGYTLRMTNKSNDPNKIHTGQYRIDFIQQKDINHSSFTY